MNKSEVSQRVLKNGKPLSEDLFEWDEKARVFSTSEDGLVIDFAGEHGCTFKTGPGCTFNTSSYCTFKTGYGCTFDTRSYCTFKTGSNCTFKTGSDCTFNTGSNCTFKTGPGCTFKTGYGCTFKTGPDCTFKTGSNCTFKTGYGCTFDTRSGCTFDTGSDCTFDTSSYCTFKTGSGCVIVRRDVFDIIQPNNGTTVELFSHCQAGHLENGMFNGKPHIIADGIVSEILSKKGDAYRVINLGQEKKTYLVTDGNGNYAHGETLNQAREDLVYKVVAKLDGELPESATGKEWVGIYRAVTGACSSGVKMFVDQSGKDLNKTYTAKEIAELVQGHYGAEKFLKKVEEMGR